MKRLLALPLPAVAAACMSYPPPPPITPNPPGSVYRAAGHAPEWTMTIDERLIAFYRPGQPPVTQPTPRVIVGIAGEIYQTPRIGVNLPHVGCTDSVTGQRFRDRAEVTVDGVRYTGCGGETVGAGEPAGLTGTRWNVTAVNGRAVPANSDYHIRFDGNRFGARFGCNGIGGTYEVRGGTLIVSDLMQTLIGCPEPSATFERDGSQVLRDPMRMQWTGTDRLRLSSGPQRTIDLVRS